jgi:hypothetical protein
VSLPTHHTAHIARREGRSPAFLETTFAVPETGPVPDPVPAIMDLCAEHDLVFDCGHVSGPEAVRLCEEGKRRGLARMRTHASEYTEGEIRAITAAGAYAEFSFFILTHATQVGLTHVDQEAHRASGSTIHEMAPLIRAAGDQAIVSSDCGVFLLPPPVEGFREFMLLLEAAGFGEAEIRRMNAVNPAALFRVGGDAARHP